MVLARSLCRSWLNLCLVVPWSMCHCPPLSLGCAGFGALRLLLADLPALPGLLVSSWRVCRSACAAGSLSLTGWSCVFLSRYQYRRTARRLGSAFFHGGWQPPGDLAVRVASQRPGVGRFLCRTTIRSVTPVGHDAAYAFLRTWLVPRLFCQLREALPSPGVLVGPGFWSPPLHLCLDVGPVE